MSINQAKRGDPGVAAVDLCDRPIFGFGNGGENQCASTVNLRIAANQRQGELRVHCLDTGDGPLQLSVDSLRKMKAVVDFAEDLICFRALDPRRVVKVERSATEHQLLPMTEDLLATARVPREDGGTEPSGHVWRMPRDSTAPSILSDRGKIEGSQCSSGTRNARGRDQS